MWSNGPELVYCRYCKQASPATNAPSTEEELLPLFHGRGFGTPEGKVAFLVWHSCYSQCRFNPDGFCSVCNTPWALKRKAGKMNVGIVASPNYPDLNQIQDVLAGLVQHDVLFFLGSGRAVDAGCEAADVMHMCRWNLTSIDEFVKHVDHVVFFWDGKTQSEWNVITASRLARKPETFFHWGFNTGR